MGIIATIIYEVIAIWAGYSFMNGRSEWLDEPSAVNQIVKFAICLFIGNLIGAFYLLYFLFRLLIAVVW